ncbi:MAG: phosphate/phosphite/phosphonate ABC transporter substrate-binding protein [Deltaproteobacteria bacterium]|nr:phosphate/phosphite/phosphonate ABC transporter substrate-binding protein [Deltaproteobacteria bacterium]
MIRTRLSLLCPTGINPGAFFIVSLTIMGAFLNVGCSDREQSKVVDFSNTVILERPDTREHGDNQLRIAIGAMVSPKESLSTYQELLDYLGEKLGKKIVLEQRKTYSEINELLGKGEVDLAFVCSGPYVVGKDKHGLELLAAPEVNGSHFYNAYLIVNKNSRFRALEDLRGKAFAFTDPDSNTGKLAPSAWLKRIGEKPETFFGSFIYTYSHDNSILAVSKGVVDGASVDGLVWEYFNKTNPNITSRTRVILKSENYGMPPLVASRQVSESTKEAIKKALFGMRSDKKGAEILDRLMIDRFVAAKDDWYNSIRAVLESSETSMEPKNGFPQP